MKKLLLLAILPVFALADVENPEFALSDEQFGIVADTCANNTDSDNLSQIKNCGISNHEERLDELEKATTWRVVDANGTQVGDFVVKPIDYNTDNVKAGFTISDDSAILLYVTPNTIARFAGRDAYIFFTGSSCTGDIYGKALEYDSWKESLRIIKFGETQYYQAPDTEIFYDIVPSSLVLSYGQPDINGDMARCTSTSAWTNQDLVLLTAWDVNMDTDFTPPFTLTN